MRKRTRDTLASITAYGTILAVTAYATYTNTMEYVRTGNDGNMGAAIFTGLCSLVTFGAMIIGNTPSRNQTQQQ